MNKYLRRIMALSLILFLLLAGCSGGAKGGESGDGSEGTASGTGGAAASGGAVATLDEHVVTADVYEFFYRTYQLNYEYDAMNNGYTDENIHEYWDMEQDGMTFRQMLSEMALDSAKQFTVLYEVTVSNGTTASEEINADSDAYVDSLPSLLGMDQATFESKYQITLDKMKEMYRQMNLVDQYDLDLQEQVEISDAEVEQTYQEGKELYDQVTVRHVLISVDAEMTEEEKAEAKTKAEDILKQIQEGADIGQLAQEHSEDTGSAFNNGEYTFPRGRMVEPFENWAFAAEPGDQGIVESDFGYHVMEMIGHLSYEEIKEQVEQELRAGKASAIINETAAIGSSPDWKINEDVYNSFTVS